MMVPMNPSLIVLFNRSRYFRGRPLAPTGDAWARAVEYWKSLPSDPEAKVRKQQPNHKHNQNTIRAMFVLRTTKRVFFVARFCGYSVQYLTTD